MITSHSRIPRWTWHLASALAFVILAGAPARAAVLFTTLDAGGGFDHVGNNVGAAVSQSLGFDAGTRTATRFSVIGGPWILESVSLPIVYNASTPSPIPLCIVVRRDNAGMPGEAIEDFCTATWPVYGTPAVLTTLTCPSHPQLVEGYYWIETAVTHSAGANEYTGYYWYSNSLGVPLPVFIDDTPWYFPAGQSWEGLLSGMLDFRNQPRALVVEGSPVGSGVDPTPGVRTELALPNPTPFRQGTVLEYSVATRGPIAIGVFSVTGARVRTLASGEHAAGRDRVTWDGRDERGQVAPAGVYIVRLEAGGSRLQQRLIKLP